MRLMASLRVYGGKCRYDIPDWCKGSGRAKLDTSIKDNADGSGIRSGKRVREGSRVAEPPRCSSMPFSTSVNFWHLPAPAVFSNSLCRFTTREFSVSIFPYSSMCSTSTKATIQAAKIFDSRCRCDRQSAHLTTA
jgi:hypothetical protein